VFAPRFDRLLETVFKNLSPDALRSFVEQFELGAAEIGHTEPAERVFVNLGDDDWRLGLRRCIGGLGLFV
jgi:hypothetical protein